MKLNNFSKAEQRAVFKHYWGGTNIRFKDMTEPQMEQLMNSMVGLKIVFNMRFHKLWDEVKKEAERIRGEK